jgi:putative transposase
MPDHSHILVEALDDLSDLRKFCKLGKQRPGQIHARRVGGPLWQEGYYDRVLRKDEDLRTVARYLLNNPLRAGLVTKPIDYPYLGSDRWTVAEIIDST